MELYYICRENLFYVRLFNQYRKFKSMVSESFEIFNNFNALNQENKLKYCSNI